MTAQATNFDLFNMAAVVFFYTVFVYTLLSYALNCLSRFVETKLAGLTMK